MTPRIDDPVWEDPPTQNPKQRKTRTAAKRGKSKTAAKRGKSKTAAKRGESKTAAKKNDPQREDRQTSVDSNILNRLNLNAAGIDIGAGEHYVAIPPGRGPVRRFGSFTADLHAIAAWLKEHRIDTVAMESTGIYWVNLMQVLEEEGFEVLLVDPYKLKHVPSRKTDVLDCQWIQELHSLGLLTGAFRPSDDMCGLRSLVRQRDQLIRTSGDSVRRIGKALHEMNVKLSEVISNIVGLTGLRIIRAILAGERNPKKLAKLRHGRCRHDEATIALALEGHWRDEHLFRLRQAVQAYDFSEQQLAECDQELAAKMASLEPRDADLPPLEKKNTGRPSHPLAFGGYEELYQLTGVDLTVIEGVDAPSALTIISEIGVDMSKWRHGKAFASWLGLCPGSKVTGGKRLSSKSRRCANRAATAFRLAAYAVQSSHSYLGAHYRRMRARLGAPKAITATAHKIARIVYAMLRDGTEYVDRGMEYHESRYRERAIANLKRNARRLGYQLVTPDETAAPAAA